MMASWTGVIIFVVAIIAAIVLGEKLKINQGIFGLVFAFIICILFGGMRASNVITECFPVSVLYLLMMTTFFYGFMNQNGMIKALADRMVYAFRNKPALIPIVTYFVAVAMSALGSSGESTVLVLSPLFFALALNLGYDPILAVIACACGGTSASFLFWSGSGAFLISILENFLGSHSIALGAMMAQAITMILVGFIVFMIYYIATKSYQVKKTEEIAKPEPMTQQQKMSFVIVLCAIGCLLVIPLLNTFFPCKLFATLSGFLDIRVVMTIGVLACILLKVGDDKAVVAKGIPWNLIIMICGMMTLITAATSVGTIEFVIGQIGQGASPTVIVILLFVFFAFLGAVTGGITLIPILGQMAPVLAATCGMPLAALTGCGLCGINAMSVSPYSHAGAMGLSGCPDELRSSLMRKMYVTLFLHAIVAFILTIAGFPSLIANLFAG